MTLIQADIAQRKWKGGEIMKKLNQPAQNYDVKKVVAYTGETGIGCNCC